jgi:hypothetical protein
MITQGAFSIGLKNFVLNFPQLLLSLLKNELGITLVQTLLSFDFVSLATQMVQSDCQVVAPLVKFFSVRIELFQLLLLVSKLVLES